ncbi:hypothetical protein FGO68_gene15422 [Halteria grandinella]|uniref:Uncharacterized protein n=1 Tax=Halteria grandinella TaxID=5974 RepID=A0A8J8NAR2_HALGN|nr:hypothetical protein FGO68_gene15422 [Halteria grandinella]
MLIICDSVNFEFFIFNTLLGVSRYCKSLYLSIALFLGGITCRILLQLFCGIARKYHQFEGDEPSFYYDQCLLMLNTVDKHGFQLIHSIQYLCQLRLSIMVHLVH